MPAGPPSRSASSAAVPAAHTPPAPCNRAKLSLARHATPPHLPLLPRILLRILPHILPCTLPRCSTPPAASPHSLPHALPLPPLPLLSLPAAAPQSLPAPLDTHAPSPENHCARKNLSSHPLATSL